jgi:hypothetical protein
VDVPDLVNSGSDSITAFSAANRSADVVDNIPPGGARPEVGVQDGIEQTTINGEVWYRYSMPSGTAAYLPAASVAGEEPAPDS